MRLATPVCAVLFAVLVAACGTNPIPTAETRTPTKTAVSVPTKTASPSFSIPNPFASPTPTPLPKPHVLRINMGSRPDLLDPQRASTNGEVAVVQMLYEGLTRLDEKGDVVPGAAFKWEFGDEGKTLTFHLRDNVRRADGTRITAQDFEYAFKRALDPRVGAVDASFLDSVQGAAAVYQMDYRAKPEDIQQALDKVGIKAEDDTTLVFSFDKPAGYFPVIASTWIGFPSDRTKVQADPDTWWLKPGEQNGNGPFVVSDVQEEYIKFVPNPNYWGGSSKLDRIEFYWIADPVAALDAYRKGEVDITRVTSETLSQVLADSSLAKELVRGPADWVTYLGFNLNKSPFNDANVRKAFSQALDREGFVDQVLQGLGKPYTSWIPPGTPGYDPTATVPGYDPEAAVKTLTDHGYGTPDGKRVDCNKVGTVKLSFSNTPRNQSLFEFLTGNLTRVFACPVLLDPIDPGTYPLLIKDARTAPQIYLLTWQAEYPHPQDWLFLQTCDGVYATRIGYCSKEFDAALTAANEELDVEKSMTLYQRAQKLLLDDVPGAILWNSENAFLIKPYVRGAWDHHSSFDNGWPGQYGPVLSYDIDTSRVGDGYPSK